MKSQDHTQKQYSPFFQKSAFCKSCILFYEHLKDGVDYRHPPYAPTVLSWLRFSLAHHLDPDLC